MMKLSENLKRIRKENNLSQEQLAEKIGVSRQAVSKWESGQSYPEMDKVLMICKLFNLNIDELMNENIKEVNENKQSKINFNKYIDDFFEFINKTVDMLSSMNFKQKMKCFIEQCMIVAVLLIIFFVIGSIGSEVLSRIFGVFSRGIYYTIRYIFETIFIILGLVVGVTVFLHIFKIRYLDYYEIVKEDKDTKNIENELNDQSNKEEKQKILIEKKKERIIIRDPKHTQFKFLTLMIKAVVIFIKAMAVCLACGFSFLLVGLVAGFVLSFIIIKTGLLFIGILLGLIAAIVINYIILDILYHFIVSKKCKKARLAICFIISLVLEGIGVGLISIGTTQFNYVQDDNKVEDIYHIQMSDNLSINDREDDIEYIETDSEEIKIVLEHSKYSKANFNNRNETVNIYLYQDNSKMMEAIRENINNLNNKEIKDYDSSKMSIYTSKENIEKLKRNQETKYNDQVELSNLYEKIREQEQEIIDLNEEMEGKDNIINQLEEQLEEKKFDLNE